MTFLINGRSPRFRVPGSGGGGSSSTGAYFSICGGLNIPDLPSGGQIWMIWTADGSEPAISTDGTYDLLAYNETAGMWWVGIGYDCTYMHIGPIGEGVIFAIRPVVQSNCG